MPILIEKMTKQGVRYAVQFESKGRPYQTLFTSFYDEAISWGKAIKIYGWSVSGRPMPIAI